MQEREFTAEYAPLPEEFEGQGTWVDIEEPKKKKNLSKAVLCAAAAMLLFSLTIQPQFLYGSGIHIPESPVEPEPVIVEPEPEPVIENDSPDYEILGLWNYEEEYYCFSEDGSGFYYSGECFSPVSWEVSGTDYAYFGGGLLFIDEKQSAVDRFKSITREGEGGIYLDSHVTGGQELFVPAASMYIPFDIFELFEEPVEDRIQGYWRYENSLDPYPSVMPLYVELADGNKGMLHTQSYNGTSKFESFKFEFDKDVLGKFSMKSLEGDEFTFEFYDEGWTASFSADAMTGFYFVDKDGEGLLVYGFHGASILRKEVDY